MFLSIIFFLIDLDGYRFLNSDYSYNISIFVAFNEYVNLCARITVLSNMKIMPIMDINIWIATFIAYQAPS